METEKNINRNLWAATGILAAASVALFLKGRADIKKAEKVKRRVAKLAKENLAVTEIACDGLGIPRTWKDGKNRKLPIDSEEAAGYRMLKSVQDAERALNRAVIACVSKLEDEKCSLEFIRELVCGDYNVTSATPISVQRRNAETTVEIVEECLGSLKDVYLDDISHETLIKAAVLLENDILWAVWRGSR